MSQVISNNNHKKSDDNTIGGLYFLIWRNVASFCEMSELYFLGLSSSTLLEVCDYPPFWRKLYYQVRQQFKLRLPQQKLIKRQDPSSPDLEYEEEVYEEPIAVGVDANGDLEDDEDRALCRYVLNWMDYYEDQNNKMNSSQQPDEIHNIKYSSRASGGLFANKKKNRIFSPILFSWFVCSQRDIEEMIVVVLQLTMVRHASVVNFEKVVNPPAFSAFFQIRARNRRQYGNVHDLHDVHNNYKNVFLENCACQAGLFASRRVTDFGIVANNFQSYRDDRQIPAPLLIASRKLRSMTHEVMEILACTREVNIGRDSFFFSYYRLMWSLFVLSITFNFGLGCFYSKEQLSRSHWLISPLAILVGRIQNSNNNNDTKNNNINSEAIDVTTTATTNAIRWLFELALFFIPHLLLIFFGGGYDSTYFSMKRITSNLFKAQVLFVNCIMRPFMVQFAVRELAERFLMSSLIILWKIPFAILSTMLITFVSSLFLIRSETGKTIVKSTLYFGVVFMFRVYFFELLESKNKSTNTSNGMSEKITNQITKVIIGLFSNKFLQKVLAFLSIVIFILYFAIDWIPIFEFIGAFIFAIPRTHDDVHQKIESSSSSQGTNYFFDAKRQQDVLLVLSSVWSLLNLACSLALNLFLYLNSDNRNSSLMNYHVDHPLFQKNEKLKKVKLEEMTSLKLNQHLLYCVVAFTTIRFRWFLIGVTAQLPPSSSFIGVLFSPIFIDFLVNVVFAKMIILALGSDIYRCWWLKDSFDHELFRNAASYSDQPGAFLPDEVDDDSDEIEIDPKKLYELSPLMEKLTDGF